MTEAYPLKWPIGRQRTPGFQRKSARFETTPGRARDELLNELRLLGARDIVINSNVATYMKGGKEVMYANQNAAKEDPAVVVYYTWKGDQYALACDRWDTVKDNLQACNKTVAAIRGIDRWGTGDMIRAAFQGFKELPAAGQSTVESWWEVLRIAQTRDAGQINKAYNLAALNAHPDAGGSHDAMVRLNEARKQALDYAAGK